MEKYKAAAIQMNSQPDLDYNLEQAYNFIKKAAGEGARLIGLPENFAFLGDIEARVGKTELIAGRVPAFLEEAASEFGVFLLGGSFPVPDGTGKAYNRSILLGPDGNIIGKYDKIHLFDVDLPRGERYRESDRISAGEDGPVVIDDGEIGNIGLTICYDLRFPELYRKLVTEGAVLLCIPSAFTATTGRDHWKPLLLARAIENTAFVFAPAQTGTHGKKRRTHGHSMIIDPWGDILAEADKEPGIVYADIDPERLTEVRQRIPSLEHRVMR